MKKEEFKELTDAQHMRIRPAMYIGSVATEEVSGMFFGEHQTLKVIPGLLKIISEIIDNSIDEAIRTDFKFANKIHIDFVKQENGLENDTWRITVEDNGRGIPVVKHGENYQPVLAWTRARAGSNFSDDRETIGANGVGSFATAVFSSEFIGETSDGKNYLKMVTADHAKVKSINVKASTKQFTKVSFVPDLSAFGILVISDDHINFIKDRIENLAACYPSITFTFNSEKIKIKNAKEYASKYCTEFVISQDEKNVLIFGPSGEQEEFRLHSYVNGLWIKNGGSHVNYVLDQIVVTLKEHIRKKHKIDVLPNQIKQHLTFVSILRGFVNMKFDSQTKERITNTASEVATHLGGIDFDKISKQILNTPAILDPMIQAILFKKEQAEARELAKKQKSTAKIRVVNHIAATDSDPEKRILYIVEGLSAVGCHISVRNPKTDGAYPLKGKVMNVRGMKPVDIIKNKEISELLSIIGLSFGKPATDLNYGKIAIFTDSDTDGDHIFALLMNLFSNWPELFTEGRINRCTAPLYYCTKGKDLKSFYSKDEYEAANVRGYTVDYFKGLGSMPKEVYKQCLQNPRFIKVNATAADFEKLEMAFGDSADGRKNWMLA
jgi:DNA topoisomerase-2